MIQFIVAHQDVILNCVYGIGPAIIGGGILINRVTRGRLCKSFA